MGSFFLHCELVWPQSREIYALDGTLAGLAPDAVVLAGDEDTAPPPLLRHALTAARNAVSRAVGTLPPLAAAAEAAMAAAACAADAPSASSLPARTCRSANTSRQCSST